MDAQKEEKKKEKSQECVLHRAALKVVSTCRSMTQSKLFFSFSFLPILGLNYSFGIRIDSLSDTGPSISKKSV